MWEALAYCDNRDQEMKSCQGKGRSKGRGILRSRSCPPILPSRWASQKQKQWTDTDMCSAIDAVKGGEKILRAAKLYNVPQQTLQDRISGRVIHGSNPGPKPYLLQSEENELAEILPRPGMAKAGSKFR